MAYKSEKPKECPVCKAGEALHWNKIFKGWICMICWWKTW